MEMFDPQRPKLGSGVLAYVASDGSPIGPLERLMVRAVSSEEVRLEIWLLTDHKSAQLFFRRVPSESVSDEILAWLQDPEAFFATLGYEGCREVSKGAPKVISLEDLEL